MSAGVPFIIPALTSDDGTPVSGALVYFKRKGTSTPQSAYSDEDLGTATTNPAVADAGGRKVVYLDPLLNYDIQVKTADAATTLLSVTYNRVDAIDADGDGSSIDPIDYEAAGDAIKGTDGVATALDNTFTSASAAFTSADVGKVFIAHGAGASGAPHITTIASVNSATSIEMTAAAITTVASSCAYTYSTNDTEELEIAAAAAVTAGLWLDLKGRSYGVTEFDLPKNLKMRDGTFIDLAPATTGRKTLNHLGDYSGDITLQRITVDRNGGSTATTLYTNQAIRLARLDTAHLDHVEVYGNDAGEGIKLDTIDDVEVHGHVHDMRYVHSSQTDDTVEGVIFENVGEIYGYVHIESLGRTDTASASRDTLSRGAAVIGARQMTLDVNISRVDQGFDASGAAPSFGAVTGTISYCATNGFKVANAQSGLDISKLSITQCGLDGIIISGVESTGVGGDWTTWTQSAMVSGCVIRNIGTNQLYSGHAFGPVGVLVSREDAASPNNTFPRGITVTDNSIYSDQGSATFTVSGAVLTLQENGMPVQTGVRVRVSNSGGALPTGFSGGTDYFLIEVPGTLTCKLASSYINAIDGTAITTTGAGTGTHTLTLFQDCKYKVSFTDLTEDTSYPNFAFNNPGGGMTVGEYQNSAPPNAAIQELAQTGQLQGFKNRLINGSFICAQRTAASNADDTYTPLDRWYALTQANAIAVTQLSNAEDGAPNAIRLTQSNVSAQRIGTAQIIESINCRDLRGRKATLAGRVRTSDGGSVAYAILEWTGTGDAVTSDVVADWTSATYTAGAFFNSTTLSVLATGSVTTVANTWRDLTAILGSVSSSCNNLIVVAWSAATMAQNATLDFNRMQIEPDRKATAFEQRPYPVELALCQRYFEAGGGNAGPFWSGNTTSGEGYVSATAFKVVKRANPTVTFTNVANSGFGSTPGSATANIYGVSENRAATATDIARLYNSTYVADIEL